MTKSKVIAITGGIGCGKSEVAKIIKNKGYPVIFSDDNAKKIMHEDQNIKKKIIEYFGSETYNTDGTLNNKYLAQKVFGDTKQNKENLQKLNSIVHPAVIQKMIDEVEKLEQQGEKLIFLESALTYEAGLQDGFDYIIVVDCDEKIAIERVSKTRGITPEEVKSRMEQQIPNQRKKELADFVIENNKDLLNLKKSVEMLLEIIKIL